MESRVRIVMSKSSDFRSSARMAWPTGPDAYGMLFEDGTDAVKGGY